MSHKKMSLTKRKKIVIGMLLLLSAVLTVALFSISAASGQIKLSSSTRSVVQGKNFTVEVAISSDAPINLAHSRVTYDASSLSLQAINYSGSPYTTDSPEAANGSGYIVLSRYKVGGPFPSGDFKLATLTFRANKNSGNTTINVNQAESYLYDEAQENALTAVSGVTVSLTKPPTTNPNPTPTNNPSPTNSSSPRSESSDSTPAQPENANPEPANNESTDTESDAEPVLITESTPNDALPAPGSSRRSSDLGVGARLALIVRNVAPVVGVLTIAGIVGWIIYRRVGHSSHMKPFSPAQAAGPTVVFDGSHTVKTSDDQNQKPPLSPIQ